MKNNQESFNHLRGQYPYFSYKRFDIESDKYQYTLRFHFTLADKYHFYPVLILPRHPAYRELSTAQWDLLAFHAGMVEVVSYWKAACAPTLIVEQYHLTEAQKAWWKKLYYHGLGEFFYQNRISTSMEEFMTIESGSSRMPAPSASKSRDGVIVPVGGGKDSAVTLELMKESGMEIFPMAINPRPAIMETIENAGISTNKLIKVTRQIDEQLLQLNDEGFLNGHTPFSAAVAFITALCSELTGVRNIALSNESSANEATIPGTKINHQYSKSFEFEEDFRKYSATYLHPDINYFSFLRPLNEIQIARLFSQFRRHYYSFKSCNAGSKDNIWCGECPKCLFTAIILAPYMKRNTQRKIFGKDILDDHSLKPVFNQLSGETTEKPFECVGTIDEVRASIHLARNSWGKPLPALLDSAKAYKINYEDIEALQMDVGYEHNVPEALFTIIHKNMMTHGT